MPSSSSSSATSAIFLTHARKINDRNAHGPVLEFLSETTLPATKDSHGYYRSISAHARRGELSRRCHCVAKPVLRLQAARLQFHRRNHPRRLHRRGRLDRHLCGHPSTRLGQERCCGGTQGPHGRTYTDLYRSPDRRYSRHRGGNLS